MSVFPRVTEFHIRHRLARYTFLCVEEICARQANVHVHLLSTCREALGGSQLPGWLPVPSQQLPALWHLKELAKVCVGLSAGVPERIHTNSIERKIERRDATSSRSTGMKSM